MRRRLDFLRPLFFGRGIKDGGTPCTESVSTGLMRRLLAGTVGRASHCHLVGRTKTSRRRVEGTFSAPRRVAIFS